MLINLSNHPNGRWSEKQKFEAEKLYGSIIDLPFPKIEPEWGKAMVADLANTYLVKCIEFMVKGQNNAIHVMGEMTFTYHFVRLAYKQGIICVASTTRRLVSINELDVKTSVFEFIMFREY